MLIRGRLLFEGGAYSKIGRGKEKNAENRLLALTNFFVANAALIRGRRLFGGGAYSSKYGKSLKNMTLVWDKTCNAYDHSHIWILTTCIIGMTENKKYIILRSNKRGITLRAFTHCKSCVGIRVSQTRFFFQSSPSYLNWWNKHYSFLEILHLTVSPSCAICIDHNDWSGTSKHFVFTVKWIYCSSGGNNSLCTFI